MQQLVYFVRIISAGCYQGWSAMRLTLCINCTLQCIFKEIVQQNKVT
jgi:hypothetical protein